MIEEFRENFNGKQQEGAEFNREAEKKHRQEIRKALGKELSKALKDFGFKKTGYSLWSRKIGDSWQIVYLQRSQWSHQYYIEAGICNEGDIPKGKNPDIVFCENKEGEHRERIEKIMADVEKERIQGRKIAEAEEVIRRKINSVNIMLNFEASGAQEKYPGEYFVPSVSVEEAKDKVQKIKEMVREYIPPWFAAQSKNKK